MTVEGGRHHDLRAEPDGEGRGREPSPPPNPARPRLLTRVRRATFGALLLLMVVSSLVSIAVTVVVSRGVLADDADRRLDRSLGLVDEHAPPVTPAELGGYGIVVVEDGQVAGAPSDRGAIADLVLAAATTGDRQQHRIAVDGQAMNVRAEPLGGPDATGTQRVAVGMVVSHDPTATSLRTRTLAVQAALLAVMVFLALVVARRSTRVVESLFRQEDHLMRSVAHELRNPLSEALVVVDEGLAGISPPDEALGEAASLVVGVDELIGDLLEMARVMTGGVELSQDEVALDVVAIDAVAMSPVDDCTVELDVIPTTVRGSARLLRRAASNLVRNAASHAYGGGPGVIRVRVDDDGLSVDDDGPGVPDDDLDALRYEGKLAPHQQGAGLGLNLCGWVAEMHGGRLVLANRAGGGFHASLRVPPA